ncbi:MAG TPA: hypothetical protein ACFCUY_10085 [Xenococcaceae cyanobacterium]
MIQLISQAINRLNSFLKDIQVKTILSSFLVGLIVLTSGVTYADKSDRPISDVDAQVFKSNPERPSTSREWRQEARETDDAPLERIKTIGQESAQAVKEWGELYPDVIDRTLPDDVS